MDVNEWKYRLKDKVENDGSLPSPGVSWDALEAGMTGVGRRRMIVRWSCAVAAAVLASVVLLMPWNGSDGSDEVPVVASLESPKAEPLEIVSASPEASGLLAEADSRPVRKSSPARHEQKVAAESGVTGAGSEELVQEVRDASVEGTSGLQSNGGGEMLETSEQQRADSASTNERPVDVTSENMTWARLQREGSRGARRGRLSVGVGSGIVALGGSSGGGNIIQFSPDPGGGSLNDPEPPAYSQKKTVELETPMSFGVSAKFSFSERLFLLGGLSATTCRGQFSDIKESERLWYLGPSAGTGLNMYRSADFAAYSAVACGLDWCISHRELPLLPYTSLSAGVQFRLDKAVWLYADPQLKYTFKSENSIAGVSFKKPVQFAVSVGLRFDL